MVVNDGYRTNGLWSYEWIMVVNEWMMVVNHGEWLSGTGKQIVIEPIKFPMSMVSLRGSNTEIQPRTKWLGGSKTADQRLNTTQQWPLGSVMSQCQPRVDVVEYWIEH